MNNTRRIRKAIIPAAGLGTRFLPATKAQPKEMLPIVDKPTLQYVIEEAVASGIEEILIITGKNKKSIEDHFDKSVELELELAQKGKTDMLKMVQDISDLAMIYYVRQKEPKGLGDAIYCARNFIGDEHFAILLGDDIIDSNKPCLKQLIDTYDRYNSSIIGVQNVDDSEVSKYGIINAIDIEDNTSKIKSLIEKPSLEKAPSNKAILGRYIVSPKIFDILEKQEVGVNGELQLTDALNTLLKSESVYAYEFEGKRYDLGSKMGYLEANIDYALKRDDLKEQLMEMIKSKVNN